MQKNLLLVTEKSSLIFNTSLFLWQALDSSDAQYSEPRNENTCIFLGESCASLELLIGISVEDAWFVNTERNSMNLRMNQSYYCFSDVSDNQDFEALVKTYFSSMKIFSRTLKFPLDALMQEIRFVVTELREFQKKNSSSVSLFRIFGKPSF